MTFRNLGINFLNRWTGEAPIFYYIGEYASNFIVYASQNEINVMLNDLNAKNKMNIPQVLLARSQKNLTTFFDNQTLA